MRHPSIVLSLVLLGSAAPAFAGGDLSLEYAYLEHRGEGLEGGGESFPAGALASLGFGGQGLGFVLEANANRKNFEVTESGFRAGVDTTLLGLHAGPRYRFGGDSVKPYLQVLGGATRVKVNLDDDTIASFNLTETEAEEFEESETDLSVQPGLGVDIKMGDSFGLRVGGDYRYIFVSDDDAPDADNLSEWRFHAGVVFSFGN